MTSSTSTTTVKTPRIVGYVFGLAFIYGVWLLEPRWVFGAIALLLLYDVLFFASNTESLFGMADASLAGLFNPPSTTLPTPPNAHLGGK